MKKNSYGSLFFLSGLSLVLVIALCAPAGAATYNWKASTTGDWSLAGNWVEGLVPTNGDDAVITNAGASVILSSASSNLNSLTLSRTLTFTNWDTSLSATNVTILTNGVMTLPAAFTNNAMSNRVWIVCTNLFIASGGSINADSKGYAGAATNETQGHSPVGRGSSRAGGSYGGFGGNVFFSPNSRDLPYGSPGNPVQPGSGGGAYGTPPYRGGAGGGAILIQASDAVTVNGTVSANGQIGSGSPGYASGSGGGILITCRTLAGTNGTIQANGASAAYGSGGGGRIAVLYDAAAQSLVPQPSISFSVARGATGQQLGDIGTLYFPDTQFLISPISRFHGQWYSPGLTNLSYDTLTVSNCWLRFPQDSFTLTVTNNLTIMASTGIVEIGGNVLDTNIWEDTTYVAGTATRYRIFSEMATNPVLNCGGNLILTNGGSLVIHAGLTNAVLAAGAEVNVSGDIRVWPGSAIYPFSQPTNGGSVLFHAANVYIATNAQMTANGRGYAMANRYLGGNTWGYGPGRGNERRGAGYGGLGGNSDTNSGLTYGSSNVPVDSGSSGGRYNTDNYYGGSGGGVVRIEAGNNVIVDGTISANGGLLPQGGFCGGGSGGSIYIRCRGFAGWTGGVVRANGGAQSQPWTAQQGASGGGGRIAIWRQADRHTFAGTISCSAGDSPGLTYPGTDGTIVLQDVPPPGTVFTVY